jgi:hypothetical protein
MNVVEKKIKTIKSLLDSRLMTSEDGAAANRGGGGGGG